MKRKVLAAVLAVSLLLGLTGCAPKLELTGLMLANTTLVLAPGQSIPVEPAFNFDRDAPTEEEIAVVLQQLQLIWESSDVAVAAVDESGLVTAIGPGTAMIVVGDAEGQYRAEVAVTVVVLVQSAEMPQALTLDLLAGETARLQPTVLPANATGVVVTFASSDETVVTVHADGTLTPIGEGEAAVTATLVGDGPNGRTEAVLTTRVAVLLLPQSIALETDAGTLYVGRSQQLMPYTLPLEAPETTYHYQSSDEAVAVVGKTGTVTAMGAGEATITVTCAEGHATEYALTVLQEPKPRAGGKGAAENMEALADAPKAGTDGKSAAVNPLCGEKGHTKMGMCQICLAWIRCDNSTGPGHTELGNCPKCHLVLSLCNNNGPGHSENGTCVGCGRTMNCDWNGLGHKEVGQCPTCGLMNGGSGVGDGAPGVDG